MTVITDANGLAIPPLYESSAQAGVEEITATVLNTDPLLSVVFTVVVDATPPTGTIHINGDAIYANTQAVTLWLSAYDPESGVVEMRFSNDGTNFSEWELFTDTKEWSLTEPDGVKTVWVEYKNGAGLTATTSDDIILDMTPPAVPTSVGGVAGWRHVMLWWNAGMEPDLRGYHVYRSANCQFAPDDSTRITPQWQPHTSNMYTDTGLEPGATYYYAVTALDQAWNESALSSVFTATVPADTTPPAITILYPAHNDGTVNRFPTIRARIEDDLSGLECLGWPVGAAAGLRVILDGVNYTEQLQLSATLNEFPPTVYTLGIPLVPLPGTALENGLTDGQHTLEIRLRDIAGNTGTGISSFYMQPITVVMDALAARYNELGSPPMSVESEIDAVRLAIEQQCAGFVNPETHQCVSFVNPETGEPWSGIGELLQAALGRSSWESFVPFPQRIVDIKKVLNLMRWRSKDLTEAKSEWGHSFPPLEHQEVRANRFCLTLPGASSMILVMPRTPRQVA